MCCQAHIVVRFDSDKKYRIYSMVEAHSHGFVSPNKRHLLRSNRNVSERAKSTLFHCHKASIGTSQAYRLLLSARVGLKMLDAQRGICKTISVTSEKGCRCTNVCGTT